MKLHSDSLDALEIRKAARLAGVGFTRFNLQGSRSRAQGFDVILTGTSGRRQNFGGPDEAASWDEWGIWLGHLFRLDPNLKTPYYADAEHYVWATGGRFTPEFTPAEQHLRHSWDWSGVSVTGNYTVHECARGKNPCGAVQRHLRGDSWAEFVAATA